MWALMPSSGSYISTSDSKIRSAGLWFEGHDTVNVSWLGTSYSICIRAIHPGYRYKVK